MLAIKYLEGNYPEHWFDLTNTVKALTSHRFLKYLLPTILGNIRYCCIFERLLKKCFECDYLVKNYSCFVFLVNILVTI